MSGIRAKLTHGGRVLQITRGKATSTYALQVFGRGVVVLTKEGGESYECCADGNGPFCDCKAALYKRNIVCRHVAALRMVGLMEAPDAKKQVRQ